MFPQFVAATLRSSLACAVLSVREGAKTGLSALSAAAVIYGGAILIGAAGYGLVRGGQVLVSHLRNHKLGSLTFVATHTTSGEGASHTINIILDHPESAAAPATTTAEAATGDPTEPAGAPAPA
jgi:hypothetical protein